jgi:hypothetical protein
LAERIPARLTAAQGRRFAFTVGGAFVALGVVAAWRGSWRAAQVCFATGGLLLAAGVVAPARLGPVERAWMALAHAISRVTTPVFMGVVYYLAVLPVGLVLRVLGREGLARPEAGGGFWVVRPADRRQSDLERQF